MSLNIKNPDTVGLARAVAAETGENVTRAIHVALAERLERLQAADAKAHADQVARRLLAIGADAAGRWRPPLDTADHGELLYDERGLPR